MANFSGQGAPIMSYVGSKAGDIYTDNNTGNTYMLNPSGLWSLNSTASPLIESAGGGISDLSNLLSVVSGNAPGIQLNMNMPGNLSGYIQDAFNSLTPYYNQLLNEAGGDLNIALQNLEKDYQVGKRTTLEDFWSNLNSLGLNATRENTALQGNLNQRGMALTQTPSGGLSYAGGGRAATEVGMLNQDQALRQEALQRTKQRGIESAALTKLRGTQTAQQQYRNTKEGLQSEQQQRAAQIGSANYGSDVQNQQFALDRAIQGATYGNPQSSGASGVNPNDASSIKAMYPGYAGWNDPNAIMADYKATGGAGKQ